MEAFVFPLTMNQTAKSDAYALAATPDAVHDGTIQLPTPPAHSMAWHLIPSKHDPHQRQRRETSFALLPSTTRSSLFSCSRRGSIPINCNRSVQQRVDPLWPVVTRDF